MLDEGHCAMNPFFFRTPFIFLVLSLASGGAAWGACTRSSSLIFLSPLEPPPGSSFRIKVIGVDEQPHAVRVLNDNDDVSTSTPAFGGGPPYSLTTEARRPLGGHTTIVAEFANGETACLPLDSNLEARVPHQWTLEMEAFYAAWIEQLFDAPLDEDLSFRSLEPVLEDEERNFLFNAFGKNEDDRLAATPDCADLPYFLRSYFAWKMSLPVGYRACDRGSAKRPPHCNAATIDTRFLETQQSPRNFIQFTRKVNDTVHSGSARTDLLDNETDFYPLPLERAHLWPGTVFADPYGHTLILAKWIPKKDKSPAVLLAADAQPDNSVTRKRFWEGNFLFADLPGAGPGFKAFRPIRLEGDRLKEARNDTLIENGLVGPYSDQQSHMEPDDFYAAIDRTLNPEGLDPLEAYETKLSALLEQIRTRETAVNTAERYLRQHRGTVIPMPLGSAIFETTGPWEDYASPSRDLRLLIALKVIEQLPDRVLSHPALFALDGRSPERASEQLRAYHQKRIDETRFHYTDSQGNERTLPLSALFARREALEMGYNPNDCPERRWGAPEGSPERSTCAREAPSEQTTRMASYRNWFRSTQRPGRS